MARISKARRIGLGLLAMASLAIGSVAHASCAPDTATETKIAGIGHAGFLPAVYAPDAGGFHYLTASLSDGAPTIVGLWKFKFTSKGSTGIPDGAVIDAGYVTWHADGTEIMNSGRPPMTQSFCMGVWEQAGPGTYKLNHVAMSWDNTGTVYVGPANIRETVTLGPKAMTYSGTFSLNQYAVDGTTVLAHVQGTVSATRVTVD